MVCTIDDIPCVIYNTKYSTLYTMYDSYTLALYTILYATDYILFTIYHVLYIM